MQKYNSQAAFYKYITPSTGRIVLLNKTLRWSTPLLFNDPFDNQIDIQVSEDPAVFMPEAREYMRSVLTSSIPITGWHTEGWNQRLERARIIGLSQGPEYTEEVLNRLIPMLKYADMIESMSEYNRKIKDALGIVRVLSLTEDHHNLAMWAHYAESHKGIVIKLAPQYPSSFLRQALEVQYEENQRIFSAADILDYDTVLEKIMMYILFTKGTAWKYEKEWRGATTQKDDSKDYDDTPFDPRELQAVYLGCRIEEQDKRIIIESTRTNFPQADIYQASIHPKKFALVFSKV